MTRRRKRHAALCLFVLTTAPAFGLLCRGHAPSRFEAANLPPWERSLPRPVSPRVALRSSPLVLPAAFTDDVRSGAELARARPDDLLFDIEHPSRSRPSPPGAGAPGLWLRAACLQDRRDAALRPQQQAVALRLMEAQHSDGYLAAGTGIGHWSRAQITAHGQNLSGLLAYFTVSHDPTAVYAALQAGDLVLRRFPDVRADAGRTAGLVAAMTQLYQATGEPRYRSWAEERARAGLTDGSGLCALYVATGERHYLRGAQRVWRQDCARHQTDQDLAATLWTLTGAPGYAKALQPTLKPERYPATGRPKAAT